MQRVALIDYGSGNLHSAHKALIRAAADADIPAQVEVTDNPAAVAEADRIVLPGVGAFGACMSLLAEKPGLMAAVRAALAGGDQPFLGICVGMQLLATTGYEHGEHAGLDILPGTVGSLRTGPGLKIPHMGWNTVKGRGHPLLPPDGDAYFVHSYAMTPDADDDVIATATYGVPFTAAVARGPVAGVQFHPEKSQAYGLALLANFLRWSPV